MDMLVQRKHNQLAAARFLRKLRKQSESQRVIVKDKLKIYLKPCKALFANILHRRDMGDSNRAENSHQPTRLREAKMRCFKSIQQAQRFLSNFATIYDYFCYDQHKTSSSRHKILRSKSFECWRTIALNPSAV